jgi:hypothetical protein
LLSQPFNINVPALARTQRRVSGVSLSNGVMWESDPFIVAFPLLCVVRGFMSKSSGAKSDIYVLLRSVQIQ